MLINYQKIFHQQFRGFNVKKTSNLQAIIYIHIYCLCVFESASINSASKPMVQRGMKATIFHSSDKLLFYFYFIYFFIFASKSTHIYRLAEIAKKSKHTQQKKYVK
jgi:hypothetical protein